MRRNRGARAGFLRTLRFRFAVWIGAFGLLVLVGFSLFVYRRLEYNLRQAVDESLENNARQVAQLVTFSDGGTPESVGDRRLSARVMDGDGAVIYADGGYAGIETPAAGREGAWRDEATFSTQIDPFDGEERLRVYAAPVKRQGEIVGVVETIAPLEPVDDTLENLSGVLQGAVAAAVVVMGAGGYWLAGRGLQPVDKITAAARRISAAALSTRLDYKGPPDEIGRLAATFDGMLARLEGAFRREQQFTADAAHELRTPLAAIRLIAETTLARPRAAADYEKALVDITEEGGRLQRLVEDLLQLARHEGAALASEQLDLAALLNEAAAALRPVAETKGLRLDCAVGAGLLVKGEARALARLFMNIMDNAVKFTAQGGVKVAAVRRGAMIEVGVVDSGIGIAAEHLPHVFERFYRTDAARSAGGFGLGLAIAQAIAHAHAGTIEIDSRPGQGTRVTVRLPGG